MAGDAAVRVEESILTSASPERLWEVATDPRLAPRWNPNVTDVKDISGVPVSTGTTWTQVVKILGRPQAMHARVVECDPPRKGVVELSGPGNPRITTQIDDAGSQRRLTQIMELRSGGGFGSMALRLAAGTVRRELQTALYHQKAAAEAETDGG